MKLRTFLLLTQVCTLAVGVLYAGTALAPEPRRATALAASQPHRVTPSQARPVSPVARAPRPSSPRRVMTQPPPKPAVVIGRPRAVTAATAPHKARSARMPATVASSTPKQRLDAAIARIPGYRPGQAKWILHAKDGYWGTADWYHDTIWISPRVPAHRMFDVVAHEWSHLVSVRAYGGDVEVALARMNSYFGGRAMTGAERAADCMARVLGASWTHYTACNEKTWRQGAARLLAGERL